SATIHVGRVVSVDEHREDLARAAARGSRSRQLFSSFGTRAGARGPLQGTGCRDRVLGLAGQTQLRTAGNPRIRPVGTRRQRTRPVRSALGTAAGAIAPDAAA